MTDTTPPASTTHLVLIPSYNPGEQVFDAVRQARDHWNPVWVVVDGSTDGTGPRLQAMAQRDAGLRVIVLVQNQGKGAAVLEGLGGAAAAGFTHALTMDSDGQHPADSIPAFMAASLARRGAMVLGNPAPAILPRRVSPCSQPATFSRNARSRPKSMPVAMPMRSNR